VLIDPNGPLPRPIRDSDTGFRRWGSAAESGEKGGLAAKGFLKKKKEKKIRFGSSCETPTG